MSEGDPERWQTAPFRPSADTKLRLGFWSALGVMFGLPCFLMAWVRSPLHTGQYERVDQPVAFDHRHHVRDDGIDCLYCHYDATRSPTAGIPDTGLCMGCHGQIWTQSAMLEPIRRSWFQHLPIRWRRVHQLPDFVFFNHRIHVQKGVGCETCHGRVDLMGNVYAEHSLDMGWCLDCHRDPEPHLRPPALVTTMGYVPSEPQAALGARLRKELAVDPPKHCTGCHR